ncbi:hypothetical protein AB4920_00860 [Bifidobacterium dentium]|uniref:hypothetical protein n=1 Tax=Bifidobacterium dentium TaxID=1689 RepID=UPI003D172DEC
MKMRKLFAVVAAAATLIGGMVLSASSAQADGAAAGTTITVNNPRVGHTYTAYKFANFTNVTAGDGANGSTAFTMILSKTALDTVLNGKTATNNYHDIELTYDAVVNGGAHDDGSHGSKCLMGLRPGGDV